MAQDIDFADIGYKRCEELITNSIPDYAEENIDYYDGNHFRNGDGWVGPMLDNSHPLFETTYQSVQKMFTFKNTIREIVNREVQAASGDMPSWKVALKRSVDEENPMTPEEKELVNEAESMIQGWFIERSIIDTLREALSNSALTGESVLRFFIPPSSLGEGETIPHVEPFQVKDHLYIEAASPVSATVFIDRRTMRELALVKYSTTDILTGDEYNFIEKSWVDPDTLITFIQVLPEDEGGEIKMEIADIDLHGKATMMGIRRDAMVTPAILSLQRALNMTLTMQSRNTVSAGFLERVIMNAQLPGHFEEDENGVQKFIRDPMTSGPGASLWLSGHVIQDAEGNEKLASPSIDYNEPASAEAFIESSNELYANILSEVSQSHALIASMARVSGESRRQARSEFASAALTSAIQVTEMMEWLGDVFFSFADLMVGGTRYSDQLTIDAEIVLDIGSPPPDEMKELINAYNSGVISADTLRQRLMFGGKKNEDEKIASQTNASAELGKLKSETFLLLTRSGVGPLESALAAGYSQEFATVMAGSYTETPAADGQVASAGESGTVRDSALNNDSQSAVPNPLRDTSAYATQ